MRHADRGDPSVVAGDGTVAQLEKLGRYARRQAARRAAVHAAVQPVERDGEAHDDVIALLGREPVRREPLDPHVGDRVGEHRAG